MSEENVEVVRQHIQAPNQRDLAALTRSIDPEVEWTPRGPAAVERAVYQGRDEVSDGFARPSPPGRESRPPLGETPPRSPRSQWLGRARLRGGDASHVEVDQEFAIHFLVHGGKIARFRGFREWQAALEAAGLGE